MKDFQAVRAQGEVLIRAAGINATIIRPWYVVGPGHYRALLLLPFYWIMMLIPSKRDKAKALQLVYISQMIKTLVYAVEHSARGIRFVEVENIRNN